MKTLRYIALTAAILLAPAFALAEETSVSASADASVKTEKPRPLISPAPIIKNIKETASSTREAVKDRVDAVQTFVDRRKEDVKNLIEQKPRAGLSTTTVAAREEKREEMRVKVEEKIQEVNDRIEAAREKAKEKFGEAVQKSVGNITNRLTRAAGDLASIATRIDNRIKEYEAQGKDMSVSVELLGEARADIAAAQDKITAVGSALSTMLASGSPKNAMTKVREAVNSAEEALKTAKESLHKALESVRAESQVKVEVEASTNTEPQTN